MFPVNVSPDMAMYNLLKSQGYDPAYAIAEFIDNALQAHLMSGSDREQLNIDLHFYSSDFKQASLKNSLLIKDNGPGIAKDKLVDAMKPAKPPSEKGLSEFGIGMKAAAVWFCDTWQLLTEPKNQMVKFDMKFDLLSLINMHKEVVEVQEKQGDGENGTTIVLSELRKPIDQLKFKGICQDLRELYQKFTMGSDPELVLTAHFNGTPTSLKFDTERIILEAKTYKEFGKVVYAFGESKKWYVPIDMVFQGIQISGYLSLLETGSYVANPGIIMFRYGRVIQGLNARPYLPSKLFQTSNKYARQRVYGELYADGLPVTYTKDKFEIDDDLFAEQLRAVPGVIDLLKQAQEYRLKEVREVVSEADIPGAKPSPKPGPKPEPNPNPKPTPTPKPTPKPKEPPLLALLRKLRGSTTNLALSSIIDETIWQFQFKRELGTALCFRTVLELGCLDKIRRDFHAEYPKVSEKGIKSLLNYMYSHSNDFFDAKKDHVIVKCVQSCANGAQPDVILLNNIAHGHYKTNFAELHKFAINLEALLLWAYS
ncbi:hypothetical protein GCM10009007_08890 [Formosimonas limnophila]|uniref:ATP-binding protein n=1 Tax=Formosimonas limnophila TaxID=1384487 RepID=A0A8J3FY55_9BURK|nr:ATP-binding protein [Formosimonas limnophila]GHA70379.1 hypothetical protein GCM10009007_08890 [Formosimonas limnophila]